MITHEHILGYQKAKDLRLGKKIKAQNLVINSFQ